MMVPGPSRMLVSSLCRAGTELLPNRRVFVAIDFMLSKG